MTAVQSNPGSRPVQVPVQEPRAPFRILASRRPGLPFEEGLMQANTIGARIPTPLQLAEIARNNPESRDGFACFSGVICAVAGLGEPLGQRVISPAGADGVRYVFSVPEEYRDRRDVLLAVKHPDFTLVRDGKDRVVIVNPELLVALPLNAAGESYEPDPVLGIPSGALANGNFNFYLLHGDAAHVGPAICGFPYQSITGSSANPSTRLVFTVDLSIDPAQKRAMIILPDTIAASTA